MNETLPASLSRLQESGCQHSRSTFSNTRSFNLSGIEIPISDKEGVTYAWTLPATSDLKVAFAKEGVGKKLIKLFTRELQTGDVSFDDLVYISTKDQARVATLLADDDVRATILDVVSRGGAISLDGDRVEFMIVEGDDPMEQQELQMCRFIEQLLA